MDIEAIKEAIAAYQPNDEILEGMRRLKILATVGVSASGKTSIMKALTKLSPQFDFILDETSRQPRLNEQPGVDFLFRSREEIIDDLRNGRLVQVALGPNGDFYSTRLSSYPKGTGLIALVPAAVQEFRTLPIAEFKAAYIVPADHNAWRNWFDKQAADSGWTPEQIAGRLAEAKKSYEYALAHQELHFILNDTLEVAVRRLLQVANGELPDDEAKAREAAKLNYQKL